MVFLMLCIMILAPGALNDITSIYRTLLGLLPPGRDIVVNYTQQIVVSTSAVSKLVQSGLTSALVGSGYPNAIKFCL